MVESETGKTITFAAQLLELLHAASTTTSYKFALLLALIDLCQENVGRREGPTGSVTTREVASRVVELYWPQARNHALTGDVLRQLTRKDRSIVGLIADHRRRFGDHGVTPHRSRLRHPDAFEDLLDEVEWTLIRYPIPLLQRLGKTDLHLLYEIDWRPDPPRSPVRRYQRGLRSGQEAGESFDNMLRFFPQVELRLATLAGLLRPLVRREWTRFVARCNQNDLEDLETFLFEPERADLTPCGRPLFELQGRKCFYCDEQRTSPIEVDHFLPWSRCADDGLHNLVAAHRSCNGQKSDHLAAGVHVVAWRSRLETRTSALRTIAVEVGLPFRPERTLQLARGRYSVVPSRFPLWLRDDQFERADPAQLLAALG